MSIQPPAYEWDTGNVQHVARHRVTPAEAEEALADPNAVPLPAYRGPSGERRRSVIGRTRAGRLLIVVFTRRTSAIRVVTARDANRRRERPVYLAHESGQPRSSEATEDTEGDMETEHG